MNGYALDNNVSFGAIFLIYFNGFHGLQRVHAIDHLPYDRVNVVQLALPVINDIELALVRIWVLLRHRHHSTTVKLRKSRGGSDLLLCSDGTHLPQESR